MPMACLHCCMCTVQWMGRDRRHDCQWWQRAQDRGVPVTHAVMTDQSGSGTRVAYEWCTSKGLRDPFLPLRASSPGTAVLAVGVCTNTHMWDRRVWQRPPTCLRCTKKESALSC